MVATRRPTTAPKRPTSATTSPVATSKKLKTTLPFKASELEKAKKSLHKVAAPKPSPNVRVPHPKKLAEIKKKLKVATTTVKTAVVVKAASPSKGSPTKAASSPAKSPVRSGVLPAKRPSSADK
ncbi:hypothetical protein HDU98_012260 [Podochytrium sp. JEL0797]|nr:hypothetical protein HDU98_012260 [Podochytrium sp. JEL0797]